MMKRIRQIYTKFICKLWLKINEMPTALGTGLNNILTKTIPARMYLDCTGQIQVDINNMLDELVIEYSNRSGLKVQVRFCLENNIVVPYIDKVSRGRIDELINMLQKLDFAIKLESNNISQAFGHLRLHP